MLVPQNRPMNGVGRVSYFLVSHRHYDFHLMFGNMRVICRVYVLMYQIIKTPFPSSMQSHKRDRTTPNKNSQRKKKKKLPAIP